MALLMQAYPSATVAEIETAMTASADDLGSVGPDSDYGYGLLQAMKAWRYLNTPPPAATLLTPVDEAVNVSSPVTFSWAQAADVDGDTISNRLLLSDSPHFIPLNPIDVITAKASSSSVLFAGCGLIAAALLLRRRMIRGFRLLLAVLATLLVLSCGGGGGGSGAVIVGDVITYEHPIQLSTGTTYYWKVQSEDIRGAVTESTVRSFTTAP